MVSVFTATYNRALLLQRLYESLKRQTSKDFEWIVIDDGSADDTRELLDKWQEEKAIKISTKSTCNGGKHRAINLGINMAKAEAFFIVDSDDYLSDDAIEFINKVFVDISSNNKFAGISGLRSYISNNSIIGGTPTFENYIDCSNIERGKYGLNGDKAEVYKTSILKKHPFPEFENENFLSEGIIWDEIAIEGYVLRWYNKVLIKGEYLDDGLTSNSFERIRSNPMGWAANIRIQKKFDYGSYIKQAYSFFEYFFDKKSKSELVELLNIDSNELNRFEKIYNDILNYLGKYQSKTIAVYGYGNYGKRIEYLLNRLDLKVQYYVDRRNIDIHGKVVYNSQNSFFPNTDILIITSAQINEADINNIKFISRAEIVFNYAEYLMNRLS